MQPLTRPLLLLAEDDDDTRETIATLLSDAGYEVLPVRHGGEAVKALEGGARPQVIVLDLVMPVMNGWRFWDWLQESPFVKVPLIVFTATGLTQGAMGRVRVLQKGRSPNELLDALRVCIA